MFERKLVHQSSYSTASVKPNATMMVYSKHLQPLLCIAPLFFSTATCGIAGAASTTIAFAPLFTKAPTIAYRFTSNTSEELLASKGVQPGQPDPGPEVYWKSWIEYADSDAVLNAASLFQTDAAFLFVGQNMTLPKPSGGNGGCEGSLGSTCAENLVEFLKQRLSDYGSFFGTSVDYRAGYKFPTPQNLSCPWDIFESFMSPSSSMQQPSKSSCMCE
jgi:hypothetical protein